MSLDTYAPTTDLEAVNAILAAANEAPVDSLDAATGRGDVALALQALNETLREVMSQRWRFNSDYDFKLTGVPEDGEYVYPEPANMLAFTTSADTRRLGYDIVARPSRTFLVDGESVRILANRIGGKDALPFSELVIDPTWFVPFALAPEAARRYIVAAAIRRRVQQSGLTSQVQPAAADEAAALKSLRDAEGNASRGNIFRDNPQVRAVRGRSRAFDLRYL